MKPKEKLSELAKSFDRILEWFGTPEVEKSLNKIFLVNCILRVIFFILCIQEILSLFATIVVAVAPDCRYGEPFGSSAAVGSCSIIHAQLWVFVNVILACFIPVKNISEYINFNATYFTHKMQKDA